MYEWILRFLRALWVLKKERADVVFDGYEGLLKSQQEWNQSVDARLRECEHDRDEMRSEIGFLKIKVEDCDEDRKELRDLIQGLDERTR